MSFVYPVFGECREERDVVMVTDSTYPNVGRYKYVQINSEVLMCNNRFWPELKCNEEKNRYCFENFIDKKSGKE